MSEKYYESRIKCDVLNELRKRRVIDTRSVVASEYVLGTSGKRADLALFNGTMRIGIEIKSRHDSLSRLASQLTAYTACFDAVMLFVDTKHTRGVDDVSDCVSVFEVDRSGGISALRPAVSPTRKTKAACLQLLTMSELKKLLGIPLSRSIKRTALVRSASMLPDDCVYDWVNTTFTQTYEGTSDKFWLSVGRRKISSDTISLLSRFAPHREASAKRDVEQIMFWQSWNTSLQQALQAS